MSFKKRIAVSAHEERLEKLINERLKPGAKKADKAQIDQKIWDLFGEDWCVMFTDLSGFSRNVAKFGIIHFLQTIFESQRMLVPILEDHEGILLKTEGDSFLVIFRNPAKALQAAIAMENELTRYNLDKDAEEKVLLSIGIGYGHVLRIGDEDVFGAEVNASSKLGEDIAKAGEILVTESFKKELGKHKIKGIKFVEIKDKPPGAKKAFRIDIEQR